MGLQADLLVAANLRGSDDIGLEAIDQRSLHVVADRCVGCADVDRSVAVLEVLRPKPRSRKRSAWSPAPGKKHEQTFRGLLREFS